MRPLHSTLVVVLTLCLARISPAEEQQAPPTARRPASDAELQFWLQNMVWHHGFETAEIAAATGLGAAEIGEALQRFDITPQNKPRRDAKAPLLVLPYPGGRHPRIGFLEGAVAPQRETKASVFLPWNESGYVVADVPEAIWCQQGLLYLAHTHVPTLWTKQGIELKPLEWTRREDGLEMERELPNGVRFGTRVLPRRDSVRLEMWLTNGSPEPLTDLRVQNCVLLKGAQGFNGQTNDNKLFAAPYAACRGADSRHWVITAWTPIGRTWGNASCPCLHADPKFPDCAAGQTQRLRGWLSFYEGDDIHAELRRIDATGWQTSEGWLK